MELYFYFEIPLHWLYTQEINTFISRVHLNVITDDISLTFFSLTRIPIIQLFKGIDYYLDFG
jgi:hypothetical protein